MPQIREQIAMVHLPPSKTLKYLFHVRKTYEKSRVNLVFMRLFSFCLEMGKARFRGAFPILLRLFLRLRG